MASFKTIQSAFEELKGANFKIELLIEKEFPFAFEAGVFIPERKELWVTSSPLFDDAGQRRHEITKINLSDSPPSCEVIPSDGVDNANGGTNYKGGLLFCAQGSMVNPSGLYLVSATTPYKSEVVLTDFFGRPLNSVNDVVVASDGAIWFTDPAYGFGEGYRPKPRLPNQVYRYNPNDGSLRVMADDFGHPNGLCFSPDEKILYVTDTDQVWGDGSVNEARVSTIYAYDVVRYSGEYFLINHRVFAMTDNGFPDGIKCDMEGNVYSGCGDGVHVWGPGGVLLGKILVGGMVANFCFGRKGEMYCLSGTKVWKVTMANATIGALLGPID